MREWTWTRIEDMLLGRSRHACGKVGNAIVVAGGYRTKRTSEVLSLDSMTWTEGPQIPVSGDFYGAAVYQRENTFYLIGGSSGVSFLDEVYEIDLANSVWVERPEKLNGKRDGHSAVAVPDGFLRCS